MKRYGEENESTVNYRHIFPSKFIFLKLKLVLQHDWPFLVISISRTVIRSKFISLGIAASPINTFFLTGLSQIAACYSCFNKLRNQCNRLR